METKKYLEKDVAATERAAQLSQQFQGQHQSQSSGSVLIGSSDGSTISTFEWKTVINRPSSIPKEIISTGKNIPQTSRTLQEIVKEPACFVE